MNRKLLCIITIISTLEVLCATQKAYNLEEAFKDKNPTAVVVIGGGSAGYSAAIATTRAGWPTLVFEGSQPGGQLTGTSFVENYPALKKVRGSEIPKTMSDSAREFGAVISNDTITAVDFSSWPFVLTTANGSTFHAFSVIIATGATPRMLGIPGEEKYWGNGVSSCALCDCMFFRDKDVFIVGGGDAAVEEALQLSPFAKTVTILVRSNRMRAVNHMQEKLKDYEQVKIVYNKQVTEILGDDETVTGLELYDTRTHKKEHIKADGLFLAIGQTPNTQLFEGQIELLQGGYIAVEGRSQQTSIRGVFAAGDVEDPDFRQAIIAAGHGYQSGLEAGQFLHAIGLSKHMIERNKKNLDLHQ